MTMPDIHPDTERVLIDLALERHRQIGKGWTRNHDDTHTTERMIELATEHLPPAVASDDNRDALIEAAALLVAAVESIDRRTTPTSQTGHNA